MLATADSTNHYTEQIAYDSEWIENTPTGISWLSLLTAQPIPEETDGIESSYTSVRHNSESNCSSSSSIESCYVVLEIQRPRSITETPIKVDDEEEEEEEIEEEMEELHFAQTKMYPQNIEYEQLAISMTTEVPIEEYVVEYQQEQVMPVEEYAKVTQPVIEEAPNDILFHKAKTLSRFTKRMTAMSSISKKERRHSTSSDEESLNTTKLKTIRKINEYHSTTISPVTAEQKSSAEDTNWSRQSAASLDSIENKPLPSSPIPTRSTTTFSNLSSQRTSNPAQTQRSGPKMGTTTLTRTFAFDRACMEKYGRGQEQKNEPIESMIIPVRKTIIKQEIELPRKRSALPPLPDDTLNYRSSTNTISVPFYIGSESSTTEDHEFHHYSSIPTTTFGSNSLSKASSILCFMKKYARTVSSEYRLAHTNNENIPAEPKLLQVTYLDGRLPLKGNYAGELPQKTQTLSGSIASRLNKLGLSKVSSTQDLSVSTTSFNNSYRQRVCNRFRSIIENNSSESSPSRPWQHKTVIELFNERKQKVNRP